MKKILWSALAVVLLVMLLVVGGGWYFADQIKSGALVNYSKHPLDLEVVNISENQITLKLLPETKSNDWRTEGFWGLEWPGGYDQVSTIIELKEDSVIREYIPLIGELSTGERVRLDHFAFPGDPFQAHGISFEEVYYNSSLGSFPAWYIDGNSDTWVIFVHGGLGATRREALRMLPVVTELGLPSLVITYRNDEGVPQTPDSLRRFGITEREDLEGAANYALDHGAKDVVLVGYSLGGGIVANFLYESPLKQNVKAVILDAPMLDFGTTVDYGASQMGIPGFLVWVAKNISSVRFGIDYNELDYLSRMDELSVPILLFQSNGDKSVPIESGDTMAEARPDIVRYFRTTGAEHARIWNVMSTEYEGAVRDFLIEVAR